MGREMPDKAERAAAYYEFLGLPAIDKRQGLYYSVDLGDVPERQVKLIFLDTRWHRGKHCFPSVANLVPLGAGISAAVRWILAGFNINLWWPLWDCMNTSVLGEEQWQWLESELQQSEAAVNVVVSSIQILTTNPTVEGWGHFPNERQRLLKVLGQGISGLFVLSGDVHQAEIMDPLANVKIVNGNKNNKQSFLEITSSGMTHDCSQPFYGAMCKPLLEHYNQNRYDAKNNYYIGKNYGQIVIDWDQQSAEVVVKNELREIVLRTGPRSFHQGNLSQEEVDQVAPCVDGHLIQPIAGVLVALMASLLVGYAGYMSAP